jgi:hypothetical protein
MRKSKVNLRHSRRRASIMILVVALLVLMALIGTAYIATARSDRGSTQRNADNVQVDLLLDSVLGMCKSAVAADLFGYDDTQPNNRLQFRPVEPSAGWKIPSGAPVGLIDTYRYYNFTSTLSSPPNAPVDPDVRYDWWLANRTPAFNNSGTGFYYWQKLTQALLSEDVGGVSIRGYFEDPTYVPSKPGDSLLLRFRHDTDRQPTSVKLASGAEYPAFFIDTSNTTTNNLFAPNTIVSGSASSNFYRAVAADTDGDGIADAFLFRLPVGVINGVTYYAAARIIDNNAAINLNTAFGDRVRMSNGFEIGNRIFPSSINLNQMFSDDEINSIHAFRTLRTYASGQPLQAYAPAQLLAPLPDRAKGIIDQRTDFMFLGEHDVFWNQFASRFQNPGFQPGLLSLGWQNPGGMLHFQAVPLSDMVSFASHFVIPTAGPVGALESRMRKDFNGVNSLDGPMLNGTTLRTKPYAPSESTGSDYSWGHQNFWYGELGNVGFRTYSRRALVVSHNALSTALPPHFMPNGSVDVNLDNNPDDDVATSDMLDFIHPEQPLIYDAGIRYRPGQFVMGKDGMTYAYVRHETSNLYTDTMYPPTDIQGANWWEYQPFNLTPSKSSLNTATFRELYRTWWQFLADENNPSLTPYGATADATPYNHTNNPQRQFRSSLRDVRLNSSNNFDTQTIRFAPFQQMLLRSALAAVNTIDLRDSDDDITSRTIILRAWTPTDAEDASRGTGDFHPVEVTVFGSERQPYITEVFAHTDNITGQVDYKLPADPNNPANPKGYVAVELYNPTDRQIDISSWKLAIVDRRRNIQPGDRPKALSKLRMVLLDFSFPAATVMDPHEHLVLENFNTGNADSALKHPAKVTGITGKVVPVKNLHYVFEDPNSNPKRSGGELILLRPRRNDGKIAGTGNPLSASLKPHDAYDENQIQDMVPVDQFDFTGLKLPATPPLPTDRAEMWHYVRRHDNTDKNWDCVYPGRYDASKVVTIVNNKYNNNPSRHEVDYVDAPWTLPLDPTGTGEPSLTSSSGLGVTAVALGQNDTAASYKNDFPPIQINNADFGGYNKLQDPTTIPGPYPRQAYPFGGFMRAGDVMQVPYMGAYRVREIQLDAATGRIMYDPASGKILPRDSAPGDLLEINSLPMDCSFADDSLTTNDQYENVGRPCPIIPEFAPTLSATDRRPYDFAFRVLDYFTVIAPHDDYFPNVNPDRQRDQLKDSTSAWRYWNGTKYVEFLPQTTPPPSPPMAAQHADPVRNVDNGSTLAGSEDGLGVHGLININTANWKVLSMIPWTADSFRNEEIARQIVYQRDYGDPRFGPPGPTNPPLPFRSIYDLYNVHGKVGNATTWINFAQMHSQAPLNPPATDVPADPDDIDGDFSPVQQGNLDGIDNPHEFEQAYLLVNRISNLITVRSDSFMACGRGC